MARLGNLTFACDDPAAMAEFWAAALDYVVQPPPPELQEQIDRGDVDGNSAAAAVDPAGRGPRLFFERKSKGTDGNLPLHLDLWSSDPAAEAARLVGLGASLVEERTRTIGTFEEHFRYLKDPEGNGFCLHG